MTSSIPSPIYRNGWTRLMNPRLVSAVLAIGVLSVLAAISVGRDERSTLTTEAKAVRIGDLQLGATGTSWTFRSDVDFDPNSSQAVLDWQTDEAKIQWFDVASGTITAELDISHSATAFRRPSAHELIVSDALKARPDDGIANQGTRLLIFDMSDSLTLKSTLDLPNRSRYVFYGMPVVMSADETKMLYVRYDYDQGAPGCSKEAWQNCDLFSLVPINLSGAPSLGAPVSLPAGCRPGVFPSGPSHFVAVCQDQSAHILDGDLRLIKTIDLGPYAAQHADKHGEWLAVPVFGYERGAGDFVGVFADGEAVRLDPAGRATAQIRVLPDGAWVAGRPQAYGEMRIAIPFKWERTLAGIDGVAIVDVDALRLDRQFTFSQVQDLQVATDGTGWMIEAGQAYHVQSLDGQRVAVAAFEGNSEAVLVP